AVGAQTAAAMVVFGEVLEGEAAARVGLVWDCVPDDMLLDAARRLARQAASAPRELVIKVKESLRAAPTIADHDAAVAYELVPQVWSTQQPFFAERLAAMRRSVGRKTGQRP